jgi:hypothetical protein
VILTLVRPLGRADEAPQPVREKATPAKQQLIDIAHVLGKKTQKPVGLALGAVSGVVAGALFNQVRKALGREEQPPTPPGETAARPTNGGGGTPMAASRCSAGQA